MFTFKRVLEISQLFQAVLICNYTINNVEEEEKKRVELEDARLKIRDMEEERNREIEHLKMKHQKALIAVMLKMTEYARDNQEGKLYWLLVGGYNSL